MDAIALLKADHDTVEKHFRAFESSSRKARSTREHAAKAALRQLSVHTSIEEQVFYPAIADEVPDLAEIMLRALETHSVVTWLGASIESTSIDDDRFGPRLTVLIDNVRLHVEEEEDEIFPEIRRTLGRRRLTELGELLAKAKAAAPTRHAGEDMMEQAVDQAHDLGEEVGSWGQLGS